MALSAAELKQADDAIARLASATAQAKAAIGRESTLITWLGQGEAGNKARLAAVQQQERLLNILKAQRPGLDTPEKLKKLLDSANSVARGVPGIVEDSERMTAAGFNREVVTPTLKAFSFSLAGIGTLAALAVGAWLLWRWSR